MPESAIYDMIRLRRVPSEGGTRWSPIRPPADTRVYTASTMPACDQAHPLMPEVATVPGWTVVGVKVVDHEPWGVYRQVRSG